MAAVRQIPDITITQGSATAAATINAATLAAVAAKTNYLEGFDATGSGATGASVIAITVTGLLGGTMVFSMPVVAGVGAPVNPNGGLSVRFPTPLPASAPNVAIVITAASYGSGNTAASICAYGQVI